MNLGVVGYSPTFEADIKAPPATDLSGFYTKTQIDTTLGGYYTKAQVDTTLGGYYTKAQVDTALSDKLPLTGGTLTGDLNVQKAIPTISVNATGFNKWTLLSHTDGKLYIQKANGTPVNAIVVGTDGSISTSQLGDINTRIENRALAWANDRVANLQYRMVSRGEISTGTNSTWFQSPGGAVMLGYFLGSSSPRTPTSLSYVYPQVYDPVRGWVGFSQAY
jgi:hypothetical protein